MNHTSKFAEANHIRHSGRSILTRMTDKMCETGSYGLSNFRISPRHVESLHDVRVCFDPDSMERDIE